MSPRTKRLTELSSQAFRRLPGYFTFLRDLQTCGESYVTAAAVAREYGFTEVQVRKDLAAVSQHPGTPRRGFQVDQLLDDIAQRLGYQNQDEAILVGVGQLGSALLGYEGFGEHGVKIRAAFDRSPEVIGTVVGSTTVQPLSSLGEYVVSSGVRIGILAVPADAAQAVCDQMTAAGIRAIWNFAPAHLRVPSGVLVQSENLPAQLARLSRLLASRS